MDDRELKFKDIIEARHHADVDYFNCPDCEGAGGFMRQDGPDDWDVDMCEMCSGSGRISRRDVEQLTNKLGMYKREEFTPIREAKYFGASRKLVGELFYDDRNKDDYHRQDRVVIKFTIEDEEYGVDNATGRVANIVDIRTIGGKESWLAKRIGIGKGTEAHYQDDDHGEIITGWENDSPWILDKSSV